MRFERADPLLNDRIVFSECTALSFSDYLRRGVINWFHTAIDLHCQETNCYADKVICSYSIDRY